MSKNCLEKKSGEWTIISHNNDKTERVRGLGTKMRQEIGKKESHDSPEIPDRERTSDIHGLLLGAKPR